MFDNVRGFQNDVEVLSRRTGSAVFQTFWRRDAFYDGGSPKTKSEDPHLRSSMPHPKADFSKNQNESRRVIPWPEPSKRYFSRLTLRLFGVNEPRFSENI